MHAGAMTATPPIVTAAAATTAATSLAYRVNVPPPPPPANTSPTAEAGPTQAVDEGTVVTLNGSNSKDPGSGSQRAAHMSLKQAKKETPNAGGRQSGTFSPMRGGVEKANESCSTFVDSEYRDASGASGRQPPPACVGCWV